MKITPKQYFLLFTALFTFLSGCQTTPAPTEVVITEEIKTPPPTTTPEPTDTPTLTPTFTPTPIPAWKIEISDRLEKSGLSDQYSVVYTEEGQVQVQNQETQEQVFSAIAEDDDVVATFTDSSGQAFTYPLSHVEFQEAGSEHEIIVREDVTEEYIMENADETTIERLTAGWDLETEESVKVSLNMEVIRRELKRREWIRNNPGVPYENMPDLDDLPEVGIPAGAVVGGEFVPVPFPEMYFPEEEEDVQVIDERVSDLFRMVANALGRSIVENRKEEYKKQNLGSYHVFIKDYTSVDPRYNGKSTDFDVFFGTLDERSGRSVEPVSNIFLYLYRIEDGESNGNKDSLWVGFPTKIWYKTTENLGVKGEYESLLGVMSAVIPDLETADAINETDGFPSNFEEYRKFEEGMFYTLQLRSYVYGLKPDVLDIIQSLSYNNKGMTEEMVQRLMDIPLDVAVVWGEDEVP